MFIKRGISMSHIITYESYILSAPPQFNFSNLHLLNPSNFAKESLYYLLLADTMQAHFPFYLQFSSFDAYLILCTLKGKGKLTYKNKTYILTPHTFGSIVMILSS